MKNTPNLHQLLADEYKRRAHKNPNYSVRSFATWLGINDSTLSQFIRGKRKISPAMGRKIGSRLGVSSDELAAFLTKKIIGTRLENQKFEAIAEWYHDAILELVAFKDAQSEPVWFAKQLGITVVQAQIAIQRLLDIGLLKRTKAGRLANSVGTTTTLENEEMSSAALRKYQADLMELSLEKLHLLPPTVRSHTSLMFACSESQLERIRALSDEYRNRIVELMEKKDPAKDRLYAVQLSFFPITPLSKKPSSSSKDSNR